MGVLSQRIYRVIVTRLSFKWKQVLSRATYPISNRFLSDTHLSYEDQPMPYPTHSLELSFSQICAAVDYLATLVGIADQLSDSPFGVVHLHFTPAFSIVILWGSAHWNKRRSKTFRRLTKWTRVHAFLQTSTTRNLRVFIRY
ncbi:hypothetical protein H5410_021825 [Solanum commersonii]|uniref:Uncharacterized protein n=1 Tax=Solanum commersonii TaxID=4109 RepID=A0A9J5ZFD8_SOLCO|nr:hypothetical protein H5410_021825 [Solanum commersonii]